MTRKPKTKAWRRARAVKAGQAGGQARAAALTPERRRQIAQAAARARWHPNKLEECALCDPAPSA